jgi:poly(A) polymerase
MNPGDNIVPLLNEEPFLQIRAAAEQLSLNAFLIGGFVRDKILGRECKDIDVVCDGSGIDLAEKTHKLLGLPGSPVVFKNFGTAQIVFGDLILEFVGARKESYRAESRKPEVSPGTLEEDQLRRDFTINALAFGLSGKSKGILIDPFGGLADLENRILRTPRDPDITYSDDPLRMLRAIRFSVQLDFEIEAASLDAISRNSGRIQIISMERITDELQKMLLASRPSRAFILMEKTGLLDKFFPEFVALKGVETIEDKSHKDNFYHTLQVLDNLSLESDNIWLRWAALLHDIAKPRTKRFYPETGWTFHGHEEKGARMVPGIFKKFKLPLDERMRYVQKLVQLHLRPIALTKEHITDSALRRLLFEAGNDLEDLMMLCKADITSKNPVRVKKYLTRFSEVEEKLREVEEKDSIRNWQPPVSGEEIMEIFSIGPSREVGIIKNSIREAILEGHIKNEKSEALKLMVETAKKLGLEPKKGFGI